MSPSDSPRRPLDLRVVGVLLKKEFLDNVRNRWIIALSAIFIVLTLVVSYLGAATTGGGVGFRGLSDTVAGMAATATILVPILGLMLSYAAIVGEKERGSILLLLSMPVTRLETLLGKFLGLGSVMLVAVLSGLGVGGAVIMAFAGTEGWENFLVFLLGSVVFSLVFVSVGLLLSSLTRRRGTAMGIAVFLWFLFAFIYDSILAGIFLATGGVILPPPMETTYPNWYWAGSLANPVDAFGLFGIRAFGLTTVFGFPITPPAFVTVELTAVSMLVWAVIPLGLAFWRFRRADL